MSFSRPKLNTKRQVVADGVFRAELNEFFSRHISEFGYAGLSVQSTGKKVKITLNATRPRDVVGEKGRRISEIRHLLCKRFGLAPEGVTVFVNRINNRGLCAEAQVEMLRTKLAEGVAVRRAAYSVLRLVMEAGAIGCEVLVAGKARGQRAKGMKFSDGYLLSSGNPGKEFVIRAFRNLLMRQGMIGMTVKIMLPYDPENKIGGISKPLPDQVILHEVKE